ncbi:MAG: DoxX family protein [Desulfobulbaceae bacterium]|nr:DoxX family protein [Desulfobulbaceae bacterium]
MPNQPHDRLAADLGKFILRVNLAVLLLFHGISKVLHGIDPITGMIARAGLPPFIAYLVYIGEVAAPALVLLGVWTRPAALIIAINMVVAVLLVHTSEFFTLAQSGGWALELQAMYFISALTVALLGSGRFSIGGAAGKWN